MKCAGLTYRRTKVYILRNTHEYGTGGVVQLHGVIYGTDDLPCGASSHLTSRFSKADEVSVSAILGQDEVFY